MHGCGSGYALLVNAEVDSMGGVVDGGGGIATKTSPRRAAIEKAQVELRQEYDVREERRRELEFLEKGGNPLDFKFVNAASVSVQSTSLTDHHVEQFVTSEAKGSFPLIASPHGDSVESSGRPGAPPVCEPNSADNFDGENELLEVERKRKHPSRRNNVTQSEQSSQMDGIHNAKESEDSAIFRPYARRNRSRPNRDSARSSSTDIIQSSVGHGSSLPTHGGARDVKGLVTETDDHKAQIITSISNPKSTTSNGDLFFQIDTSNTQSNTELDSVQAPKKVVNLPEDRLDVTESIVLRDKQHDQPSEADADKASNDIAFRECDHIGGKEQVISGGPECPPCAESAKTENESGPALLNGLEKDGNEGQNGNAAMEMKVFKSESSCTQNSLSLDANNGCDPCDNRRNDDTDEIVLKESSEFEGTRSLPSANIGNEKKETKSISVINDSSVHENYSGNDSTFKNEEEMRPTFHSQVKCINLEGVEQNDHVASEADIKAGNMLADSSNCNRENICPSGPQGSLDTSVQELPQPILSEKNSSAAPDPKSCLNTHLKVVDKSHEDSILEEARDIEAKRKRIVELSVASVHSDNRRRSHWDFVLEEMAWLANDVAQERLWKMTAAAQICRRIAFTSRLRVEEQNHHLKLKNIAYSLAKAVMQYWHSAEVYVSNNCQSVGSKNGQYELGMFVGNEFSVNNFGDIDKVACKELEKQNPAKNLAHSIHGYAVRFLKYNSSPSPSFQAEAPATPDRIADLGIVDTSWDDRLTEESLFYAVPPGALEMYRFSIESHIVQSEKTHGSMQEEVDTSMYETPADFGYHDTTYDEEEGETSAYYMHGIFEGSKSAKHDQKKRKNLTKSPSARSYDLGSDSPYGHCTNMPQQNVLMGKRPASNINAGSIPTKRMRTASRQRLISPFTAGTSGVPLQAPVKTDASSGDTNSFQDDQSILHGGSQIQKSVEVESASHFERQLPYDYAETSAKPKKKKKAKHLGSAYEQGWQLDSTGQNEQRDSFKKRSESHHFDSNGTSGLYGQHAAKKPKITKQLLDNTFDNIVQMTGSIPSPAASQMSNMSNTNRFIKLIGGRERGRKNKSMKMSVGQPGSGSPWSLFEDQALVVLVHDMGPNWELISDAINSTVQFKCIFRNPKECKDRHKILMDKGAGDGADSAEDSGSSQSYPSTLPGIPKGSARQLFQHLQGPMQEDILKSHFEKIIIIGKKHHSKRSQNENQDPKQIAAAHNSHYIALSQACSNNLNGGVLSPLDLCDSNTSNPDALPVVYQGSHASNMAMPNQGAVASTLPTSGASSSLQGSSGMVLGNNSSSPSGPLNAPHRDGRYNVPRTSLPVDEQQRMQHYNQMLPSRNLQQSNLSVSGAVSGADRGVRSLSSGNGMGMMPGMNRSMPLPRSGFQGAPSSSMLNSGSMLSSNMVGMPSPVNMHTGSGQGNLMRPREALHMLRLGQNSEHQRQMMVPELQMQATQGNSQGISAFNGVPTAFANQTTTSPVQTYPVHPQQSNMISNPHHLNLRGPNHTTGSQQQTYAVRLAKERKMQQLLQHQQFAASSALMPHAQHQSQLPISSSMQNSSQISPPSSQPVSLPAITPPSPMTPISMQQQQQKHNLTHHAVSRSPQSGSSGLTNQMGKQRQRQPQQFQQSGRHHPQQRQYSCLLSRLNF
ncbi:chromatin modification-related protein EAF [Salix suchowensis]|nr:chromatin modification-related protein EAF [Salix suchowensis]